MNHQANYQRLYAPTGPAAMILPCVILGPLGMLLFGAGLDAVFKTQQLMGLVYCVGGLLIAGFLAFCLMLHIRAQQVWAWHVRTGRIPYFRKGEFLKGRSWAAGWGLQRSSVARCLAGSSRNTLSMVSSLLLPFTSRSCGAARSW